MLLTFGSFGASYLVRPVGGMVLGAYADKRGRKAALMISVGLMMIGTAIIAVIPTYASIGLLAPAGVFIARLIQGFSAGGEFGPSTAMLIEHAPDRRGLLASFRFTGLRGRTFACQRGPVLARCEAGKWRHLTLTEPSSDVHVEPVGPEIFQLAGCSNTFE